MLYYNMKCNILSGSYIIIINWEILNDESIIFLGLGIKERPFPCGKSCSVDNMIVSIMQYYMWTSFGSEQILCSRGIGSLQGTVFGKRIFFRIVVSIHLYYSMRIVLKLFG